LKQNSQSEILCTILSQFDLTYIGHVTFTLMQITCTRQNIRESILVAVAAYKSISGTISTIRAWNGRDGWRRSVKTDKRSRITWSKMDRSDRCDHVSE